MAVKGTGQFSFVDALWPERLAWLDPLSGLVKWHRFEKLLARLRDAGPGRAGYRPLLMFMPRAYIEMTLSSKPGKRRWYLGDRLTFVTRRSPMGEGKGALTGSVSDELHVQGLPVLLDLNARLPTQGKADGYRDAIMVLPHIGVGHCHLAHRDDDAAVHL